MKRMITILGPTACGKTAVATHLAARLTLQETAQGGTPTTESTQAEDPSHHLGRQLEATAEIISADSRQVFRGMDIGTGKDLKDYDLTLPDGRLLHVPYHLIDIAEAGTKYSVFEFQRDFLRAHKEICSRAHTPILCGGTGLYIESVLRTYKLVEVPVNASLRAALEGRSLSELTQLLATYKRLHNTTDVDTARRAIRAIEIEEYYRQHHIDETHPFPDLESLTIGMDVPRELRRERISARLRHRLDEEGMIDEVQRLLDSGIPPDALISYGLEYRYLTLYLTHQLTRTAMEQQLEIAIHQFAKRQMTYFRGMERRGVEILWIDATRSVDEVVEKILQHASH